MILNNVFSMLAYDFVIKALIVGVCISLCSSLLGVNMVLKNKAMIGDGLSHVAFGACAIAACLNWAPLIVSIPVVVISAFIILKLSEKSKIHGDSLIALFASSSLAIGYIAIKLGGLNKDLDSYLYGNIYMISTTELILTLVLTVVVIGAFVIFYNRIFSITFDEDFSKSSGVRTEIYNIIISILCAFTVVIGMKVMGTLLITSLIVFPVLSARQICKTYKHVVIASAIISVLCFVIGIITNLAVDLPVGATIVVINLIVFIILLVTRLIMNKSPR
ncbi:MAG: metal ABC transporter permease [Acholeplasmatales bacterium]|nr:metal ABC transporter permease [Acholeplasmatales bacterium]